MVCLALILTLCTVCACNIGTCKVTFIQGEKVSTRIVQKGQAVTNVPMLQPKRGYTVTWGNVDLTNIQGNITVYAEEIPNVYTITYNLGEATNAQIAAMSQEVTFSRTFALQTPTADGFEFVKWVVSGTDTEFTGGTYDLDSDVTLVAVWKSADVKPQTYTVTFVQGEQTYSYVVDAGASLTTIPTPTPKRGYTVKWSVADFSKITSNLTVTAVETPNTYTIIYNLNGVSADIAVPMQDVTFDKAFTLHTPTASGYDFDGWFVSGSETEFVSGTWDRVEDVTLVAKWTKLHTVTFVQDGYDSVTRTVRHGEDLTDIPEVQPKRGYTVVWDVTDFSNVTSDITVTAVETPNTYTITYNLAGVSADIVATTQKVTYGASFELYTPTAEEFEFLYWFVSGTDEQVIDGIWNRDRNVTLVAAWKSKEVETFAVSFIQSTKTDTFYVKKGGSVTNVPDIAPKKGYTLTWEDVDLTNVQREITVHVVETPNTYTITYNLGTATGATMSVATQQVTFDELFTLGTPTAPGYTFLGWYNSATDEKVENGTWNIADNVTLVAKWGTWSDWH